GARSGPGRSSDPCAGRRGRTPAPLPARPGRGPGRPRAPAGPSATAGRHAGRRPRCGTPSPRGGSPWAPPQRGRTLPAARGPTRRGPDTGREGSSFSPSSVSFGRRDTLGALALLHVLTAGAQGQNHTKRPWSSTSGIAGPTAREGAVAVLVCGDGADRAAFRGLAHRGLVPDRPGRPRAGPGATLDRAHHPGHHARRLRGGGRLGDPQPGSPGRPRDPLHASSGAGALDPARPLLAADRPRSAPPRRARQRPRRPPGGPP